MHIAFDAKRLFLNNTGLGNYSRSLVSNFKGSYPEHKISLCTNRTPNSELSSSFHDSKNYQILKPGNAHHAYWRTLSVKKDLIKHGVDLYHGLSHEIPVGISKTGIKSVVTIHDLIYKRYPNDFKSIDRWIYDRKFRYACKHADHIIAISDSTKKDIVQLYSVDPKKISIIAPICNEVFYEEIISSKKESIVEKHNLPKEYLLFVGALSSRKNLHGIIEALSLLNKNSYPPLVVIGKGANKKDLLKLVKQHDLESKITWLADVDQNELPYIYNMAKLFIYPSLYEGFGLPVLESMLCGTPVITSRSSSMPEVGGDACSYVDPKNPVEISKAVKDVLEDDGKSAEMIQKGYLQSNKFDPGKLTKQLESLYQSLVS